MIFRNQRCGKPPLRNQNQIRLLKCRYTLFADTFAEKARELACVCAFSPRRNSLQDKTSVDFVTHIRATTHTHIRATNDICVCVMNDMCVDTCQVADSHTHRASYAPLCVCIGRLMCVHRASYVCDKLHTCS